MQKEKSMNMYNQVENRKIKYKELLPVLYNFDKTSLEDNGYVVLKDFYNYNTVKNAYKEFEQTLPKLKPKPGHTLLRTIQPFVDCPSTIELSFDERLISVCFQYLANLPCVTNANIKRNFPGGPAAGTQLFHEDPESKKLLKVFVYLDDVTIENGPFVYVSGSHKTKIPGHEKKQRWGDSEIAGFYGKDSIKYLTANVGDVIIADTSGFHKGLVPRQHFRTMLTIYYLVTWEEAKRRNVGVRLNINKEKYSSFSSVQQAVGDLIHESV